MTYEQAISERDEAGDELKINDQGSTKKRSSMKLTADQEGKEEEKQSQGQEKTMKQQTLETKKASAMDAD